MKEKILTFIIGVLVGAIIATSGFLIYSKMVTNNSKTLEMMENERKWTKGRTTTRKYGTTTRKTKWR